MNQAKLKLSVMVIVTALMVFWAGAARAGYTLHFHNQTQHEVKAEVWEIKFIGVYKSLGKKMTDPGQEQRFKSQGGFCLYKIKATIYGTPSGTLVIEKELNPGGMECGNCTRKAVKKQDGTYDIVD